MIEFKKDNVIQHIVGLGIAKVIEIKDDKNMVIKIIYDTLALPGTIIEWNYPHEWKLYEYGVGDEVELNIGNNMSAIRTIVKVRKSNIPGIIDYILNDASIDPIPTTYRTTDFTLIKSFEYQCNNFEQVNTPSKDEIIATKYIEQCIRNAPTLLPEFIKIGESSFQTSQIEGVEPSASKKNLRVFIRNSCISYKIRFNDIEKCQLEKDRIDNILFRC